MAIDTKTNLSKLYNGLVERGFTGIGADENEFETLMQKEDNRKKVYETLSSRGFTGIGKDYDSFSGLIYSAPEQAKEIAQPENPEVVVPKPLEDAYLYKAQDEPKENNVPIPQMLEENKTDTAKKIEGSKADIVRTQLDQLSDKVGAEYSQAVGQSMQNYERKMDASLEKPFLQRFLDFFAENGVRNGDAIGSVMRQQYRYTNGIGDPDLQQKIGSLKEAEKNITIAEETIKEADRADKLGREKTGLLGGFVRGFGNDVTQIGTWDQGQDAMQGQAALMEVSRKVEQGEELTEEEKDLLQAQAVAGAVQELYGDKVGRGFKAGRVTAQSLPFMWEMMVNPASGYGKTFGRGMLVNAAKKAGTERAAYLAKKVGTRVLGDAIGSLMMAETTGQLGVLADTMDRMNGDTQWTIGDDGKALYTGITNGDSLVDARRKAVLSRSIENFSEMVGEYFLPIGKAMATTKTLGKAIDSISKLGNTQLGKIVSGLEKRAKWNGTLGEFLEEEIGGVMNAILVGDQTIDANPDTGVFNPSAMLDTFLGVAFMGGAISAVKTGAYGVNQVPAVKRHNLDKANSIGEAIYGLDEWQNLTDRFNNASTEDELKSVMEDEIYHEPNRDKRRALLNYYEASVSLAGANLAEAKKSLEKPDEVNTNKEQAFDEGFETVDPVEKRKIKRKLDAIRRKLDWIYGIDYIDHLTDGEIYEYARNSSNKKIYLDYLNLRAAYDGMIYRAQSDIDNKCAAASVVLNRQRHLKTNTLLPATLKDGRQVHVVDGDIRMIPSESDGSMIIDKLNSSKDLFVYDDASNQVQMIPLSDISVVDTPQDYDEVLQSTMMNIRESIAEQTAAEIDGTINVQPGSQVVFNGKPAVVQAVDEAGNVTVTDGSVDGNGNPIVTSTTFDSLQAEKDAIEAIEDDAELDTEEALKAEENVSQGYNIEDEIMLLSPDGEEVKGVIVSGPDEEGRYTVDLAIPINGEKVITPTSEELDNMSASVNGNRMRNEATNQEEVNNLRKVGEQVETDMNEAQEAKEPSVKQAAGERIPRNESGEKFYEQAAPEDTYQSIVDELGNIGNADTFVASMISDAESTLSKLEKGGPELNGKTPAEKMAAIKEHNSALDVARASLGYWKSVKEASEKYAEPQTNAAEAEDQTMTPTADNETIQSNEKTKQRVLSLIKKWEKILGISVRVINDINEIESETVKEEIAKGENVRGWYDVGSGYVVMYMPGLLQSETPLADTEKVFIHEVVSHKGLRGLLGKEKFDELMDSVWDRMASFEKERWLKYVGYVKGDEVEKRRAAADEFVAHLSEILNPQNASTWDKIVAKLKEILAKAGLLNNISIDDLSSLLVASFSNLKKQADSKKNTKKATQGEDMRLSYVPAQIAREEGISKETAKELVDNGMTMGGGLVMSQLAAQVKEDTGYITPIEAGIAPGELDIRFSKPMLPQWINVYGTKEKAKKAYVRALQNFSDWIGASKAIDEMVSQGEYLNETKMGPLRTNIEYKFTFDLDTSCPRTFQYLYLANKVEKMIGRPLTLKECQQLIEQMRVYGYEIPCVYCYAENKRQAMKQAYNNYIHRRHAAISATSEEDAREAIKPYLPESGKLSADGEREYQRWRKMAEKGDVYNPTIEELYADYTEARNKVFSWIEDNFEKDVDTLSMGDEKLSHIVMKALGIEDADAGREIEGMISEWKWFTIEKQAIPDFEKTTDYSLNQDVLRVWRDMTSYAKSSTSAKLIERYEPYTGQLSKISKEVKDYINGMGGLRMHSSNDFRIDYVLDYFQLIADMEADGWKGHTYTKSPFFVRIFGNTGYRINMSLAAYGGKNGEPVTENSDEGMSWDDARKLAKHFKNAGPMFMSTNMGQLQWALDQDWIQMIIPFHSSGLPKWIWDGVRGWDDFTSGQNEALYNKLDKMRALIQNAGAEAPLTLSEKELEKLFKTTFGLPRKADAGQINAMYQEAFPNIKKLYTRNKEGKIVRKAPHFLPGNTIVSYKDADANGNELEIKQEVPGWYSSDRSDAENVQEYFRLCREYGVRPRFQGTIVKDANGNDIDVTQHPGYIKLIKETARTDSPQDIVRFKPLTEVDPFLENIETPGKGITPMEYALQQMKMAAEKGGVKEGYHTDPFNVADEFVREFVKYEEVTGKQRNMKYLTPRARQIANLTDQAVNEKYNGAPTDEQLNLELPYHPVDQTNEEFVRSLNAEAEREQKPLDQLTKEDFRYSKVNNNQRMFVSNAEQAVEGLNMGKATGENWIKAIQGRGGLKASEDKWIGLSDWLKEQKGQVSKEDVQKFIAENRIRIEETRYGMNLHEDAFEYEDRDGDPVYVGIVDWERAVDLYNQNHEDKIDANDESDENVKLIDDYGRSFIGKAINPTRIKYTTKNLDNKREIALTIPTIESWKADKQVHFGDAGNGRAIAWVRFGETKDSDGNKVLVIDEIQSMRHQEAREKDKKYIKSLEEKYGKDSDGNFLWKDKATAEELATVERAGYGHPDEKSSEYSILYLFKDSYIPAAPFEKNWHELAMKRMLRLAAEEGYDKVAWTNGGMQSDRYGLGGVVDNIAASEWIPVGGVNANPFGEEYKVLHLEREGESEMESMIHLYVNRDGKVIAAEHENGTDAVELNGKSLSEVVGKELSQKILASNSEEDFNGENLRIGGEGMEGFYDRMLPAFMDKYGKKWGVKTQDMELPEIEGIWHSVDVTPEMKESVMQGQVMFSKQSEDKRKINNTIDQAVAFVTGKTVKQARQQRLDEEYDRKVKAGELYGRVLNNQFDELTLRLINNYIENATPKNPYGRRISKRLPQKMERRLHAGERNNAVDALFSRISEIAVGKASRNSPEGRRRIAEKKKELLKGWAIATGNWHTSVDDFVSDPKEIGHGKDSQVYTSKNPDRVVKVSKGKNEEKRFFPDIDATNLFSFVFPNMAYDIIGYGEIGGKFVKFLEQQAVGFDDNVKVSEEERVEYMKSLGFRPLNKENTLFTNGDLVVADLQKANIVKGETGKIRVIDADVRLHTKDIGGQYTYPDVEEDIAESGKNDEQDNGDSVGDDIRFSFVGATGLIKAAKTDEEKQAIKDNLNAAKVALRKPDLTLEDKRKIKLATGWELGPDGKVRHEIPNFHTVEGLVFTEQNPEKKLNEVIKNDNGIFDMYPDLADVTVRMEDMDKDVRGAFNPNNMTLRLNGKLMTDIDDGKVMNPDIMSSLEHEIQHAIQHQEGWAKGGSPEMFMSEPFNLTLGFIKDMMRKVEYVDTLPDDLDRQKAKEVYFDNMDDKIRREALADVMSMLPGASMKEIKETLHKELDSVLEKQIKAVSEGFEANDKYHKLAGEIEARNSAERAKMSDEERANTLAEETEDVAREEAIIRFSKRTKPAPKETIDVYKLMRLYNGKLYPLYIDRNAMPIELKSWYDADAPQFKDIENLAEGFAYKLDAEGNVIEKKEISRGEKGNISGLPSKTMVDGLPAGERWIAISTHADGEKAYYNVGINGADGVSLYAMRPGWHAGKLPSMWQIGKGAKKNLRDDSFVWVRGKMAADHKFVQGDEGMTKAGDMPTRMPVDGYYEFMTNPKQSAEKKAKKEAEKRGEVYRGNDWYVSGAFMPEEIISDSEARRVIDEYNAENGTAVPYDFERESGKEFNAETMSLEPVRFSKFSSDELHRKAADLGRKDYIKLTKDIYFGLSEQERGKIVDAAMKNGLDFDKATADYLASLQDVWEANEDQKKVYDMAREVFGEDLSDSEIRYLLWKIAQPDNGVFSVAEDVVMQRNLGVGDYKENDIRYSKFSIFGRNERRRNQTTDNGGAERKDGTGMAEDPAIRMGAKLALGNTGVYEEELAAQRSRYSEADGANYVEEQIGASLIGAAKREGKFIPWEKAISSGTRLHGNTKESTCIVSKNLKTITKLKDPYAARATKGNSPFDIIEELIVHNELFPETAYRLVGITQDEVGNMRFVLEQDYVDYQSFGEENDIAEHLQSLGLKDEGRFIFGNERLAVLDAYGENVLVDESGKLRFIDPIIKLKRSDGIRFSKAFHGSGADFDKFSTDFMSTGEGNQAYGWGTYVTDNEETGKAYANLAEEGQRHLYTVEIPDDDGFNYLHWDEPMTQKQAKAIQQAIVDEYGDDLKETYGDDYMNEIKSVISYGTYGSHVEGGLSYLLGNQMDYATGIDRGAERNARLLNKAGIVGMQVDVDRNGGKRYKGSNYVIYNPEDAKITDHVRFSKKGKLSPAQIQYEDKVRIINEQGKKSKTANFWNRFQEAHLDNMKSLKELQSAILAETGKELRDTENAYQAENSMSSRNKAAADEYVEKFYKPLVNEVRSLMEKGADYTDILNYMIAKHGIERNDLMRARAEASAQEDYEEKLAELNAKEMTEAERKEAQQTLMDEYRIALERADHDYSGLSELTGEEEDYNGKAQELISAFEDKYETKPLWEKVNAATKRTLKTAYEGGLMTKAKYEKVRDMFQYYVPLRGHRDGDVSDIYDYLASDKAIREKTLKTIKGRISVADDPIAMIGVMGGDGIVQANRNLMKQKLLNLVLNNPTQLAKVTKQWYIKDPTTKKWIPANPDIPVDAEPGQVNDILQEFEKNMKDAEMNGLAKQKRGQLSLGKFTPKPEGHEHEIHVRRAGEEYVIYVNGSPRAAQAVNGMLAPEQITFPGKEYLNEARNFMARMFTSSNPAFILTNGARDIIWASTAVSIKESKSYKQQYSRNINRVFFKTPMIGLVHRANNGTLDMNNELDRYFSEFLRNGGETGFTAINTLENYKKSLRRMEKDMAATSSAAKGWRGVVKGWDAIWNSVEFMNRAVEDMTRFSVYMTSRQMGRSISRSVYDAKEITVNFNKKGSGEMGQNWMSFFYIFYNATMQSLSNLGKLWAIDKKKMAVKFGEFALAGMALPALTMILQSMFNGDDDDDDTVSYFDLPEWVRRNNLVFWVPFTKKTYITIPLPHELRPVYGIGENALSAVMKKEDVGDAIKNSAEGFTNMIPIDFTGNAGDPVINLTPTAVQPFVQIAKNIDFFGKPIYKKTAFNEEDPNWTKAYKGTNAILVNGAKMLSDATQTDPVKKGIEKGAVDINPAIIEHLFESYLGGVGKTVNRSYKTVSMLWDDEAQQWRNVPVLNAFVQQVDERSQGSQLSREYYDELDKYKATDHTLSRLRAASRRNGGENMEDYLEKMATFAGSEEYRRYEVARPYILQINNISSKMKNMNEEERKDADDTRTKIKKEMLSKLAEFDSRKEENK